MIIKPNVFVLVATYNGLEKIDKQIQSILKQRKVNISLFISDDFSVDGTYEYIKTVLSKNENIFLLDRVQNHDGAGANFLRLISDVNLTNCDYIAFADQDDIWLENKLFEAIKLIKLNGVDGYSGNVTAFWPNGKKKLINKAKPQQKYDYMFESAGPGCTFVLSRKLAQELKNFLVKNREARKQVALHDWFTYAFARSNGFGWIIDKSPYMLYRQHEKNVVGANVGIKAKINRLRKIRKGWYINQVMLLARLLEYETEFPMKALMRFSIIDRVYLIANFRKFRRNFFEAIALAAFFLLSKKK